MRLSAAQTKTLSTGEKTDEFRHRATRRRIGTEVVTAVLQSQGIVVVVPQKYAWGMKVKTSVTLSEDIVKAIDRLAGRSSNRSAVIERAVREMVAKAARAARDLKELEVLNRHADHLNREADDALTYQADE